MWSADWPDARRRVPTTVVNTPDAGQAPWRPRLARWLDLGALILVAQAVATHLFGGYRIGAEPFVISTRSAGRILLEVLILIAVRHVISATPSLRARLTTLLQVSPLTFTQVTAREWAIATVAFVPLTMAFLWPQVVDLSAVPDHGDPLYSIWSFAHIARGLANDPLGMLDGGIFHPEPWTFMWADLNLLPGVLAAPFIWLGVEPATMFGVVNLSACWLSGVTMYVFLRRTGLPVIAAATGGALFAFTPYRFAQYSHLQLQGLALLPPAALAWLRFLEAPSQRRGVIAAAAIAALVWWSTYLGAFMLVALGGLTLGWWVSGQAMTRDHCRGLVVALVAGTLLMTPYLVGYAKTRHVIGERPRGEVMEFSATLADYTNANRHHAWYGSGASDKVTAERQLNLGVAPWLLAGVGLLGAPTSAALLATSGLVTSLDGSLGLRSVTYEVLFEFIPVLAPLRVPARFGLLVSFFLVWTAALGVGRLWRRASTRWAQLAVLTIAGLAVLEARPALSLKPMIPGPSAVYAGLPADRDAVVLELPVGRLVPGAFPLDPRYLYAASVHGHRLINGYSGHFPNWYFRLGEASAALPEPAALETVLARRPEYIVVHEELYGPEQYAAVVGAFDAMDDVQLVATAQTPRGQDRLYAVRPSY